MGAWFAEEGGAAVEDRAALRQMNMAIALAASRWNEFAVEDDALERMRAWLEDVRRRAVVRDAQARVEAIDRARAWLDACAAENG